MSTVLLGLVEPGLEVTTILWQHTAGVLAGTFSIIPNLSSNAEGHLMALCDTAALHQVLLPT